MIKLFQLTIFNRQQHKQYRYLNTSASGSTAKNIYVNVIYTAPTVFKYFDICKLYAHKKHEIQVDSDLPNCVDTSEFFDTWQW